jgi:hypothetical protein
LYELILEHKYTIIKLDNMPGDALDDLLDYRAHEKDVFRDVDTNMDIPVRRKGSPVAQPINDAFGLGIDDEIKITKKRKPIAKLDEKRYVYVPWHQFSNPLT